MTVKLLSVIMALATLIPSRVVVAGVTVHVQAAALAVLLAAAAALLAPALRVVRAYPSSPYLRRGTAWRCA